jgi:hypothetical protein
MSELFLRLPGFGSGAPRGLFHAILGISSPMTTVGSQELRKNTATNGKYRNFIICPPGNLHARIVFPSTKPEANSKQQKSEVQTTTAPDTVCFHESVK